MSGRSAGFGLICAISLFGLLVTPAVLGESPDYGVLGELVLPWECGEEYRISWDPQSHWDNGKAGGVAFDFVLPEGTPLFSPAHGEAHSLLDGRPIETNYGNYVDLVVEGGGWLIRLAHLRDARSGQAAVRMGDPIGHSGRSGVTEDHLHIELLVRGDVGWERPDLDLIDRFFGVPFSDFVEQAMIANQGCAPRIILDGNVAPDDPTPRLGESIQWVVPHRNDGRKAIEIHAIVLHLQNPLGEPITAEARGPWLIDAKGSELIAISHRLNAVGEWKALRLTYDSDNLVGELPVVTSLIVSPGDLRLARIDPLAGDAESATEVRVGEPLTLAVWIENRGDVPVPLRGLVAHGTRPDGEPWQATSTGGAVILAGQSRRLELEGTTRPQTVGTWRLSHLSFVEDEQELVLGPLNHAIVVNGPELRAQSVDAYPAADTWNVFLNLTNVGTEQYSGGSIEVWGWKPEAEGSFSVTHRGMAPLAPGRSTLIRFEVPLDDGDGTWRLVEAGYWSQGAYFPVSLPDKPTLVRSSPIDQLSVPGQARGAR